MREKKSESRKFFNDFDVNFLEIPSSELTGNFTVDKEDIPLPMISQQT